MTYADHTTDQTSEITFTVQTADLEALVRVMSNRLSSRKVRKVLEWFYAHGSVTRPEDRNAGPSNVVRLGSVRAERHIEREFGPCVLAKTRAAVQQRRDFMTMFALRLEAELAIHERIEARKGQKARK